MLLLPFTAIHHRPQKRRSESRKREGLSSCKQFILCNEYRYVQTAVLPMSISGRVSFKLGRSGSGPFLVEFAFKPKWIYIDSKYKMLANGSQFNKWSWELKKFEKLIWVVWQTTGSWLEWLIWPAAIKLGVMSSLFKNSLFVTISYFNQLILRSCLT